MKITNLIEKTNSQNEICFNIETSEKIFSIFIKSSHPICSADTSGNAILCGTLIPAMKARETIEMPCHLDQKLLSNSKTIQEIYQTWYPQDLDTISIKSLEPAKASSVHKNNNVGVFFSAGVDSFYTLLKNQHEITHIIYVHGFDIALSDIDRRNEMSQSLQSIAKELNVELVEITTNLREFSDQFCNWGAHYFGSALAMMGHIISPSIQKIYISSDVTYQYLDPWGSHVLIAPLWNTTNSNQVFFGMSTSRLNKCVFISDNKIVQKYLHACWEHKNNNINCGICEKCIRTMTAFYFLGKLNAFSAFKNNYSLDNIKNIDIKGPVLAFFWQDILTAVQQRHDMKKLADEIEFVLNKYKTAELISHANTNPDLIKYFVTSKKLRDIFFKKLSQLYFFWLVKETIKELIKFLIPYKKLNLTLRK